MSETTGTLSAALGDRYRIDRHLGEGGMATVYLAEDLKHHRQVAVKVLRPELAASIGTERFLREIEIAASLRHPHILPLYDSGGADGVLFYVMPYAEGETLRDRLNRETQLPIEDAVRIAGQVADALAVAHAHGVVHRDIKPENILLESGLAVVADFGIARAVTQAGGDQLTETGMAVGTPAYMSPEQAAGSSEVTERTDVYALGAVLYEMLVGEPPFTGPNAQAVVARALTEEAPSVTSSRATVAAEIDQVVQKALAKVPADRHASAAEFSGRLKAVGDTQPVAVQSSGGPSKPLIGVAAAVMLVILALVLLLPRGGPAASDAGRPTLAVLPFDNLGDPDDEYFADGLTEELTTRLAQISGLQVTARTSTRRYKDTTADIREIGAELGVQFILEGTVRTDRSPGSAGQVRVTPQLVSVEDNAQLWTEAVTASLVPGEVFALQASVAESVAVALNVAILGGERAQLTDGPTENQDAHDAYLLGRYHWAKRTDSDLRIAADHFQRAFALDSSYAEALSALAQTYALYDIFVEGYEGGEGYALAAETAREAIALDSTQSDAWASLGYALMNGEWDWAGAERAYQRAIELDPTNAVPYYWYAQLDWLLNREDDALSKAARAVELDPVSAVARVVLTQALQMHGRDEEALSQARTAHGLEPPYALGTLRWMLVKTERFDEALETPGRPDTAFFAVVRMLQGQGSVAEAMEAIDPGRPTLSSAGYYRLIGADDQAFEALNTMITDRTLYPPWILLFASLRDDPRWAPMLQRMGLEP